MKIRGDLPSAPNILLGVERHMHEQVAGSKTWACKRIRQASWRMFEDEANRATYAICRYYEF